MVGGGQPDMHGVEPAVERGLQILEPPSVPADQPDRQPLVEDREHRLLLRPAHDRNPDLERVDADLGQDPRDLHLLGLGEGDPGRLLALAKGRVFEHDRHRKLPSVQRNRCPRPGLGGRRRRSRGADLAREVAGRSLQQGHVPMTRLLAPGAMGEAHQVPTDKSVESEAENRRVVVRVNLEDRLGIFNIRQRAILADHRVGIQTILIFD